MKEVIALVEIIEILQKFNNEEVQISLISKKKEQITTLMKRFEAVDWVFLDKIEGKTKKEIEKWIEKCLDEVYL